MNEWASEPIGRTREINLLKRAFRAARSGEKRGVLLHGEAGSGKTMLLRWARKLALEQDFQVAFARAPAAGSVPPSFPLGELLGQLVTSFQSRDVPIPRLLAVTAERFRPLDPAADGLPPDVLQVAQALSLAENSGRLALLLDDIQWAPREGIELLLAALRLLGSPVVFLTGARADSPEGRTLMDLDAGSDLPIERVRLEGLDESSVSKLATRVLGDPILPSVARDLRARTGGNPLFVQETLRAWDFSQSVLHKISGYWGFAHPAAHVKTEPLLQILRSRLNSRSSAALEFAQTLAVVGRAVQTNELPLLFKVNANKIWDSFSELEDAGIVSRNPLDSSFELSHPLYQDALLSRMNETQRASTHSRVLSALRYHVGSSPTEIAYHATRALDQPEDLLHLIRLAAREAEQVGSNAEAAHWYQLLCDGSTSVRDKVEGLHGQASAVEHFDAESAAAIYTEAIAFAQDDSLRCTLLMGRARAYRRCGKPTESLRDLIEAKGLSIGEAKFQVTLDAATIHAILGELNQAEEMFQSVLSRSDSPLMKAQALGRLGMVACVRGNIKEALRFTELGLREASDKYFARYLESNRAWFLVLLGEWEEAAPGLHNAIGDARSAHDLWQLTGLVTTAALLAAWRGDYENAIDHASEALQFAESIGKEMDRISALETLGFALLEQGRAEDAVNAMALVPDLIESSMEKNEVQHALVVLGEAHLRLGDLEGAKHLLTEAQRYLPYNIAWKISVDRLAAEIALAGGNTNEAMRLLTPWCTKPSDILIEQGLLRELLARTYSQAGLSLEAITEAEEARRIFDKLGAHAHLARVIDLVSLMQPRRRGRPRSSRPFQLTERESEVLQLVMRGKTNPEIGAALFISPATVKKHVENVKTKLGVHRRSELVTAGLSLHQTT